MSETGHPYRIGLTPHHSPRNAFVNLFTRSVRDLGASTAEAPYHLRDLKLFDCVILHWPWMLKADAPLSAALKGLTHLALARRMHGLKIIWVAHNETPHDGGGHPLVARLFYSQLDGIIYLSERSRELVRTHNRIPSRVRELVTVHGLYESTAPVADSPPVLTGQPIQLLNFGQIRKYKGLEELIASVHNTDAALHLTVTGKVYDPDYAASLYAKADGDSIIALDLRANLIEDDVLEKAIDAAHGIVLPYRKILNSGAAIHALSRNRPVLVPNQGSMPELRKEAGSDWVHLFDGELTGVDLSKFIDAIKARPGDAKPDLTALSWERVSRDLTSFLKQLKVGA